MTYAREGTVGGVPLARIDGERDAPPFACDHIT
jgi:hypothetical protein